MSRARTADTSVSRTAHGSWQRSCFVNSRFPVQVRLTALRVKLERYHGGLISREHGFKSRTRYLYRSVAQFWKCAGLSISCAVREELADAVRARLILRYDGGKWTTGNDPAPPVWKTGMLPITPCPHMPENGIDNFHFGRLVDGVDSPAL